MPALQARLRGEHDAQRAQVLGLAGPCIGDGMVPPGTRYAIANGDICLPPDLVHRVMHEKRPPP